MTLCFSFIAAEEDIDKILISVSELHKGGLDSLDGSNVKRC
jgi:hypothetical protein